MTQSYMWGMALGLLVAATGTDLVDRHIPNELLMLGAITGGYLFVQNNEGGLMIFMWRWLWPILLLYLFYLIGGLGAGDVKLIGCLGLYLPGKIILQMILYSFLIGGAFAFLRLIQTRRLYDGCYAFSRHFVNCLSTKQISAYNSKVTAGYELHFTICILCGALLCMIKEGVL